VPTSGPLTAALVVEQLWHAVPGGSGTYVRELTSALLDVPGVNPRGIAARHGHTPATSWAPPAGLPVAASALPRPALYEAWNRWRRPRTARRLPGADVIHATTWAIPPATAPLVVTVHDLAFLDAPEHFTRRGNAWFRRALATVRDEAAVVIADSSATRDACLAQGIDAGRLVVIPLGVRVPVVSGDAVAALRARFGLSRPYLLWCGTVEPRKNVARLVRAFCAALAEGLDLDLVLAGPAGWGDEAERVGAAADEVPAGRVHVVGELSFAEIHAAYAGARAFAFPSLREGFGMPVLEAMAHGLPVVTTAETPMAEIGGDAVMLVDATDTDALAASLMFAAGPGHDDLAARAAARAADFSWASCAAATTAAYHRAATA